MAKDIKEFLDAFKIDKVSILGFSDGANLAMIFAKLYPSYVDKLVLNSGNVLFKETTVFSRITSYIQYYFLLILYNISSAFKNRFLVAKLLIKDLNIKASELKRFHFPCLVIVGENDLIYLSHSKDIASTIPNGEFIKISNNGHLVARRDSKLFNSLVIDFLKES